MRGLRFRVQKEAVVEKRDAVLFDEPEADEVAFSCAGR
jgi:hypothetical protein